MNTIYMTALAAAVVVPSIDVSLSFAAKHTYWLPSSSGLAPVALVVEKLCIASLVFGATQVFHRTTCECLMRVAGPVMALLLVTTGVWLSYAGSANCHWMMILLWAAIKASCWFFASVAGDGPDGAQLLVDTVTLLHDGAAVVENTFRV